MVLAALVAGSLVYCVLTVIAAVRYRGVRPPEPSAWPAISVLKPLAGVDEGLEENLARFSNSSTPNSKSCSPCAAPPTPPSRWWKSCGRATAAVPSRLIVTGEPPYPNAKVYSLDRMLAAARQPTGGDGR